MRVLGRAGICCSRRALCSPVSRPHQHSGMDAHHRPDPEAHLRPARRRNCLADGGDVVLKRGPAALMIRGGAGRVDLGIVRDKEAGGQLVRVPNLRTRRARRRKGGGWVVCGGGGR